MNRAKAELYSSYMMDYLFNHPNFLGFNMPIVYCLDKQTDVDKFIKVWETVRQSHKELDGIFIKEGGDWYLDYKYEEQVSLVKVEAKEKDIHSLLHSSIEPFIPGNKMYRIKIFETECQIYIFIDIYHALMDGTGRKNLTIDIAKAWNGEKIDECDYFHLRNEREKQKNEADCLYFEKRYGGISWDTLLKPDSNSHGKVKYMFIPFENKKTFRNSSFLSAVLKAMAIYNRTENVLVTWAFHSRLTEEEKRSYGLFMRDFPVGIIYKGQSIKEIYDDVKEQVKMAIEHMTCQYDMEKLSNTAILYTAFQNDNYDIVPLSSNKCRAEYLLENYDEQAEDAIILEMRNDHCGCMLSFKYDSGMYKDESIRNFGEMIMQFMLELQNE